MPPQPSNSRRIGQETMVKSRHTRISHASHQSVTSHMRSSAMTHCSMTIEWGMKAASTHILICFFFGSIFFFKMSLFWGISLSINQNKMKMASVDIRKDKSWNEWRNGSKCTRSLAVCHWKRDLQLFPVPIP